MQLASASHSPLVLGHMLLPQKATVRVSMKEFLDRELPMDDDVGAVARPLRKRKPEDDVAEVVEQQPAKPAPKKKGKKATEDDAMSDEVVQRVTSKSAGKQKGGTAPQEDAAVAVSAAPKSAGKRKSKLATAEVEEVVDHQETPKPAPKKKGKSAADDVAVCPPLTAKSQGKAKAKKTPEPEVDDAPVYLGIVNLDDDVPALEASDAAEPARRNRKRTKMPPTLEQEHEDVPATQDDPVDTVFYSSGEEDADDDEAEMRQDSFYSSAGALQLGMLFKTGGVVFGTSPGDTNSFNSARGAAVPPLPVPVLAASSALPAPTTPVSQTIPSRSPPMVPVPSTVVPPAPMVLPAPAVLPAPVLPAPSTAVPPAPAVLPAPVVDGLMKGVEPAFAELLQLLPVHYRGVPAP